MYIVKILSYLHTGYPINEERCVMVDRNEDMLSWVRNRVEEKQAEGHQISSVMAGKVSWTNSEETDGLFAFSEVSW